MKSSNNQRGLIKEDDVKCLGEFMLVNRTKFSCNIRQKRKVKTNETKETHLNKERKEEQSQPKKENSRSM